MHFAFRSASLRLNRGCRMLNRKGLRAQRENATKIFIYTLILMVNFFVLNNLVQLKIFTEETLRRREKYQLPW